MDCCSSQEDPSYAPFRNGARVEEMTVLGKDFSARGRREIRDGSFQFLATLLFGLSLALFVILMGLLMKDLRRKFLSSYESYALPHSSSSQVWHSMSEEELMRRASMLPLVLSQPHRRTPKVAFMFLARGRLPLEPIWEKFFKGHESFFSIYLHSSPEFTDDVHSESSVFHNRRIPSKPVEWGRASMVDAERRLLANALLDCSNERFVLLSETCIPIFNFTTIYNQLINSNHSFLSSFDDPRPIGRGRYNKRMSPTISISEWRKGSQWFEVHRKLAIQIVSDRKYYPVFKDHCMPPCYMDEHYLATLVAMISPGLNSNRTITWVDWSTRGSHPKSFLKKDVSEALLNQIRDGSNCTYNGRMTSVCFLFARKFQPSSLEPLLKLSPTLLGF
ncbi:hypothetical protein Scep_016300 [Stephania cephalantha]|uniref:Core-2/I-branching beta-1,6-N-acetylglucosaminyltransferase family protein n=1 Tax=Stephania cephalantha TaxID=152367 RepID=A0AAP0NSH2_9MAGN